jgi:hypothetical protein
MNAELFGWIGGLLGIGALKALDDEYQRAKALEVDVVQAVVDVLTDVFPDRLPAASYASTAIV